MPQYTNAKYVSGIFGQEPSTIQVDINGVLSFVPMADDNTDYQNIMILVAEGKLVIAPADGT